MDNLTADDIKRLIKELGADLCAIAPVDRFSDAPAGFHPADILKECQSIVVFAVRVPKSVIKSPSKAVYTLIHLRLFDKLNSISITAAMELEKLGAAAVPIPASDPYEYWDDTRRHGQGILSLKHAAVRAGLGKMGKNTLLVNDRFGNMILLGAVLTNQELVPDETASYEVCLPDCRICLESCPAKALDGQTISQRECRPFCGKSTEGGGFVYNCNLCRTACPKHQGI